MEITISSENDRPEFNSVMEVLDSQPGFDVLVPIVSGNTGTVKVYDTPAVALWGTGVLYGPLIVFWGRSRMAI